MKPREKVARFIEDQLRNDRKTPNPNKSIPVITWHYGLVELRDLLDYIYESEPQKEEEKIKSQW